MTIEVQNNYKVRNPGRVTFVWTTDEGNITYTLSLRPQPGGASYNPYKQDISVTSSDAEVNGNTWSYTLSVEETNRMYNAKVPYEWWVEGTSTSSHAWFVWKPDIPDDAVWVNPIPDRVYENTLWVAGSCDKDISAIYVNDVLAEMLDGMWRISVSLEPGYNTIKVEAVDSWGVRKTVYSAQVFLYEKESFIQNIWTDIDERAAMVGIYRDDGEDHWSFEKARIQVQSYRVNSTLSGVKSGLSAELRKYMYDVFSISIKDNSCSDFMLASDAEYVYYSTDRMVKVEEGRTDEAGLIGLDEYPVVHLVKVYVDGREVLNYEVDDKVVDTGIPNKHYRVSYRYCRRISKNCTLGEFMSAFLDYGDLDIFFVNYVNTNAYATGIEMFSWDRKRTLAWSPVEVYPLGDEDTQRLFGDEQDVLPEFDPNVIKASYSFNWAGLKIDGLAEEVKKKGWFGWSDVVLDVSHWTQSDVVSCALLPALFDAKYRRYSGYIPPVAEYNDLTDFVGILFFQGGVCLEDDLEVEV